MTCLNNQRLLNIKCKQRSYWSCVRDRLRICQIILMIGRFGLQLMYSFKSQLISQLIRSIFIIMIKINELQQSKENQSFEEYGIKQNLIKVLQSNGYIVPKYTQVLSLPHLFAKKDCMLVGPCQSGKKMALLMACLQMIDPKIPHCQAILLAPCREVAFQLYDTITKLCSDLGITVRISTGGAMVKQDCKSFRNGGIQLVIGTPGRVNDMLQRRAIRPDYISYLGLIDLDQLICRGFDDQIMSIIGEVACDCQVAFSSSTFYTEIQELALKITREPCFIETPRKSLYNKDNVRHFFIMCNNQQKINLLLDNIQLSSCLIFIQEKEKAEDLMKKLKEKQLEVQNPFNYYQIARCQSEKIQIPVKQKQIVLCIGMQEAFYTCRYLNPEMIINFEMPKPHEYSWRATVGEMSNKRLKRIVISFVTEQERQHVQILSRCYNIPINYLPFFQ